MITHLIKESADGTSGRDSVGGRAVLPRDFPPPRCECGKPMVLFFQFDVRPEFGLPFVAGSHLTVFMCPKHNDAPEIFSGSRKHEPLPPAYWLRRLMIHGHTRFFELVLHRPAVAEVILPEDAHIEPRTLTFERAEEVADNEDEALRHHPSYPGVSLSITDLVGGRQGFKVGGQPSWAQAPETRRCACGAEMRFVCQVPQNWPFAKKSTAPSQPDSFSGDDYCLFLGNEVYLFACEAQCDSRAVDVIVQN